MAVLQVCQLEELVEQERLRFTLAECRLQQLLSDEQLKAERYKDLMITARADR